MAGEQGNSTVIAHNRHEGDVHLRAVSQPLSPGRVGVGADLLGRPGAVGLVADAVFHVVINDVVVEEGSDVGRAHVCKCCEGTGFAGTGDGIRGGAVGNHVVGGEPEDKVALGNIRDNLPFPHDEVNAFNIAGAEVAGAQNSFCKRHVCVLPISSGIFNHFMRLPARVHFGR